MKNYEKLNKNFEQMYVDKLSAHVRDPVFNSYMVQNVENAFQRFSRLASVSTRIKFILPFLMATKALFNTSGNGTPC